MNRFVFRYAMCLLSLLPGLASANPFNTERMEKLEPVYQRILLQEATLAAIGENFPDLVTDLEKTRKLIDGSIAGEGEKGVVDAFAKLKADEWKAYSEEKKKTAQAEVEGTKLTQEAASKFLDECRKSHDGIAHPDLRVLLSAVPRFVKNPELEYKEGYVVPFVTRLSPKAYKGLDIAFQVPASWDLNPSMVEGSIIAGTVTGPGMEPMLVQMDVKELDLIDGRPMTFDEAMAFASKEFSKAIEGNSQFKVIEKSDAEFSGRKYSKYVLEQKIGDTPLVTGGVLRLVFFGTPVQGKWLSSGFGFLTFDGAPMTQVELQKHYTPLYTKMMESIVEPPK